MPLDLSRPIHVDHDSVPATDTAAPAGSPASEPSEDASAVPKLVLVAAADALRCLDDDCVPAEARR